MSEEIRRLQKALKEDQELDQKLKDLYEENPDGFAKNSLEILKEKGFDVSEADLESEEEVSLEELDQVAGGGDNKEWDRSCRVVAYVLR